MPQIENESVHLIVTSPPYFNAPHDYCETYSSCDEYLNMLENKMPKMVSSVAARQNRCEVRFDLAGQGSAEDKGFHWYFDAVWETRTLNDWYNSKRHDLGFEKNWNYPTFLLNYTNYICRSLYTMQLQIKFPSIELKLHEGN